MKTTADSTEAIAALRESEARLRAVFSTAVEGILTIDDRGRIDSVNPAAERMFGWTAEELIGRNISTLMPEPYRAQHDGYLANYLSTGQRRVIGIGREVFGQRKDGSMFPIDLSVGEFSVGGRRLFTGIVRDITERRRLQSEVLRIGEMAQQRIGRDLHDDLCQQLAGIEFLSQSLANRLEEAGRPESGAAEEIARLIRSAVGYTRDLSHGMSPMRPEPDGLLTALEELAARTAHHFKLEVTLRNETPVAVPDAEVATHLYRIAQEAVSNAIRHGRATRIEIGLAAVGERVHLVIQDNGRGLPRLPARKKGMGLRIMQYRAGIIGGSLVIQSEPNGGTTVGCSVHLHRPTPAKETSLSNETKKRNRPRRKASPAGR